MELAGVSWWPSGQALALSLPGPLVQSLVGDLRSRKLRCLILAAREGPSFLSVALRGTDRGLTVSARRGREDRTLLDEVLPGSPTMAPPRPQLQVPGASARPGAARCSHLGRQLSAQPPCPRDPQRLFLPSGESEPVPTTLCLTPLLTCSLVPSALLPSQTSSLPSVLSSDPLSSLSQPEAFLANLLVQPLRPPQDLSPTAPCPAAATASLLASLSRITQDSR